MFGNPVRFAVVPVLLSLLYTVEENPELVLSCRWYLLGLPEGTLQEKAISVPETLAPLAGEIRPGAPGKAGAATPLTKLLVEDHDPHPALFWALTLQ